MEATFQVLFRWVTADPSISFYICGAAFVLMYVLWAVRNGLESGYSGWIPFLIAVWASTWAGVLLVNLDVLVSYEEFILIQTQSPVLVQVLDLAILAGLILFDGFWFLASKIFTRGGGVATITIISVAAVPYCFGLVLGPAGIWSGITLVLGTTTILAMIAYPRLRPPWRITARHPAVDAPNSKSPSNTGESKKLSGDRFNLLHSFELEAARNPALIETVIIMDCTRLRGDWVTPCFGGRVIALLGQGQARAAFAVSYFLWNHYFRRLPGLENLPEEMDLPTLCGRALAQLPSARNDMTRDKVA